MSCRKLIAMDKPSLYFLDICLMMGGIKLFIVNKVEERINCVARWIFNIYFLIGVVIMVYTLVSKPVKGFVIILLLFYLISLICHESVRINGPRLVKLITVLNCKLGPKALASIKSRDNMLGVATALGGLMNISMPIVIGLMTGSIADVVSLNFVPKEDDDSTEYSVAYTIAAVSSYLVYIFSIYGCNCSSMALYTVIAYYFGLMADAINVRIKLPEGSHSSVKSSANPSANHIHRVRLMLRIYFELKSEADNAMHLLPFAWFTFAFIACTGKSF